MLKTLRKKVLTSRIIRAVVSLVITAAILICTHFSIVQAITGPIEMDVTKSPSSYVGKYVTIDVQLFLTEYVEHTTTTTSRYGSSTTNTDGYSYIVLQMDAEDDTQVATWYFFSVYLNKTEREELNTKINQAWDWLEDETGTVAPPETMRVTGTWKKMDDEMLDYYKETLAELGITASDYDVIYNYSLETGKIGGVPTAVFWLLMAAALVLLVYGIYNIVLCCGSAYAKKIQKYLDENAGVSVEMIDADFAKAHVVSKDTWIGRKWTVYIRGPKVDIVANKDLIWGYYYRKTGRYGVSEMRLYKADGSILHLSMTEKDTKEALQYYIDEQPQMVIGYTKDLEKLYQKDLQEFLRIRYRRPAEEYRAEEQPQAEEQFYAAPQQEPAEAPTMDKK